MGQVILPGGSEAEPFALVSTSPRSGDPSNTRYRRCSNLDTRYFYENWSGGFASLYIPKTAIIKKMCGGFIPYNEGFSSALFLTSMDQVVSGPINKNSDGTVTNIYLRVVKSTWGNDLINLSLESRGDRNISSVGVMFLAVEIE